MADQQIEAAQNDVASAEAIAEARHEDEPDDPDWGRLAFLLANIDDRLSGVEEQLARKDAAESPTPEPKPTEDAGDTETSSGEHTEVGKPPDEVMVKGHKKRGLLI